MPSVTIVNSKILPLPFVYTRTNYSYAGINSTANPQTYTLNLPAAIQEGDLMVLVCSSRGPAHNVTTIGWNLIRRVETFDSADGGSASFLTAYRVRQAGDTQVVVSRTNTTSRLASFVLSSYRANRVGGAWSYHGEVFTSGVAVGDSFTAQGLTTAGTDSLVLFNTFLGVSPLDGHKAMSSGAYPYVLGPDTLPRINTRMWHFLDRAGWFPGVLPEPAQWTHVMHLPEVTATGDVTYTLGDTTTPRLNVHHAALIYSFRYVGGSPA